MKIEPVLSDNNYKISSDTEVTAGITVATLFNKWTLNEDMSINNQGVILKNGVKEQECVVEIPSGESINRVLGYSAIFDSNGCSLVPTQNDIEPGGLVTEPESPEWTGKIFAGWYKDEKFTDEWDFQNNTVNENVVLYAKWIPDLNYYKTVILSVKDQENQAIIVPKGSTVDASSLNEMYDLTNAKLNWDAGDLKLLEKPITENLVIKGVIVPDSNTGGNTSGGNSGSGDTGGNSDSGNAGGNSGGGNTGGSGEGEAGITSYAINIDEIGENGSVTVDNKKAVKGETVTVTVKPNEGYKLDKITITDKNGKQLEIKELGNNKYSFAMPDSKADIKASFVKNNSNDEKANDTSAPMFTDVEKGSYYEAAVKWAVEKGITTGTSPTTFSPNQACTRGQVVTFLWRAAGCPAAQKSSFADVKSGSYYEQAVSWAVEKGITNGMGENQFSPDTVCTRAQIVTFLARFDGMKDADTQSTFKDVPKNAYYAGAVKWAVDNNITTGTSQTTFSPNDNCTRAQTVTFLYKLYGNK